MLMSKEIDDKELIFIYNAKSGFINELVDFAHKIISPETYDCNLCAITYGAFRMKKRWADYIQSLPINSVFTHQDKFYNMVIEIDTNLIPMELLNAIKAIEEKAGRKVEKKRNMPRVLDIDILAIGSLQIHSGLLEIPHTGISERKFVLKPWNDIAPKFRVPGQNALVSEILENTDDKSDVRMVLILDKKGML